MPTLYERLNSIPVEVEPRLNTALLLPPNTTLNDYLGGEILQKGVRYLSSMIVDYLRQRGTQIDDPKFGEKFYYSFLPAKGGSPTTEPLLTILYGRIVGDRVPDEVFQKLTGWEALYFLAGICGAKTSSFKGDWLTRINVPAWSIREKVARIIIGGVKKLNKYEKEEFLNKSMPRKEEVLKAANEALEPQLDLMVETG